MSYKVIEMPHVVLTGDIDSEKSFNVLEDIMIKLPDGLLKTTNHYLDKNKQSILIESLAIQNGNKIGFLAMINNREDGIVIRIYPGLDIEKTDRVKQILAEIAKKLLNKIPKISVDKTNLQEFLR